MPEKKDDIFVIDTVAYFYEWIIIGKHKLIKDKKLEIILQRSTLKDAKRRLKVEERRTVSMI
ncbi:MAG: hypothetical protein IH947_03890 [Bacteroidetes bacterium]|nr:hypothetical protein [Bacteroidota bacterium]